jgi:hypothetical protein
MRLGMALCAAGLAMHIAATRVSLAPRHRTVGVMLRSPERGTWEAGYAVAWTASFVLCVALVPAAFARRPAPGVRFAAVAVMGVLLVPLSLWALGHAAVVGERVGFAAGLLRALLWPAALAPLVLLPAVYRLSEPALRPAKAAAALAAGWTVLLILMALPWFSSGGEAGMRLAGMFVSGGAACTAAGLAVGVGGVSGAQWTPADAGGPQSRE